MPNNNAIIKAEQRWQQLKTDLPIILGEEYVNFAKQAFIRQGFIDGHYEKWKPRKDKSKRNKGRAILVKSGRLKRSLRILQHSAFSVTIGSDVPYAQIQNDGGSINKTVSVRGHKRKAHSRTTYAENAHSSLTTRRTYGGKRHAVSASEVESHERKMNTDIPARPFIGESAFFNKRAVSIITRELKKCFAP